MARLFYRIGQFWRGLWATVTPDEEQRVAKILPAAAFPLFAQMPKDAQRHSLNVLASVWAAGHHHPDLDVAALLHDCGKVAAALGGVKLALWVRGPLVVFEKLLPALVARWASPEPSHQWRYALHVHREHPAIGAAWAAKAGCSELSCWLIAHHQTPLCMPEHAIEGATSEEAGALLAVLQKADNGN
jgi:hypothetical protein